MSVSDRVPLADERANILLVDDRADKLLTYEVMLAELNQNLVQAHSGKDALRFLLQQDFAVILLDVNMPNMDGFETAAMIRQRLRSETTPIIFISAVNEAETHVSRGYSLGAVDYIRTPVVPEILRAKIAVFVDLFKKTQQVKRQAEEHVRLAEAEARQARLAFLADAGSVLAGSLDYQETFQNLANLIVPRLADFCLVHAVDGDGALRQTALAAHENGKDPQTGKLARSYPATAAASHGSMRVLQTGQSKIFCDMSDDTLKELFERAEDRQDTLPCRWRPPRNLTC